MMWSRLLGNPSRLISDRPGQNARLGRGQTNLRRGFFRLWLVFSALFVIATAVVYFKEVGVSDRRQNTPNPTRKSSTIERLF